MQRIIVLMIVMIAFMESLSAGLLDEYSQSCSEGDMQGCYHLGAAYSKGDGVHKSLKNARRFLEFACDEGVVKACTLLQSLNKKVEAKNYKGENRQDSSTVNNKIKEYVLGVIKHGSAQFNYPMGTMPKGMVTGADAEYVAEYVSEKMRGEKPATFAVCAACHGTDGRGNGGLSADLLNLKGVVLPGQRMDAQSIER